MRLTRKTAALVLMVLLVGVVSAFSAPKIIEEITIVTMDTQPGSLSADTNPALYKLTREQKKGIDIQEDTESYAYFLSTLAPAQNEIRYIDSLIADGYSAKALVQIFEFWKDTEEDIDIIEEVYEYRPDDLDLLYWVDSAFLGLSKEGKTKTKYSDLSVQEVKEYYSKGISYEDMRLIDKLSRKGTKDIKELMLQKENNTSWYEIINGVYEFSSDGNNEKYCSIENPDEIMASYKLAKKEKKEVIDYLEKVLNGESAVEIDFAITEEKYNEIKSSFIKEGIWSEEKSAEIAGAEKRGGGLK